MSIDGRCVTMLGRCWDDEVLHPEIPVLCGISFCSLAAFLSVESAEVREVEVPGGSRCNGWTSGAERKKRLVMAGRDQIDGESGCFGSGDWQSIAQQLHRRLVAVYIRKSA